MLGCVSFGGPAAHIGYFRKTFVEQKKWLSEEAYGRLIALSQFLPGPGSSQVCFALGLQRGGLLGGLCASFGFTLPSFILMFLLALWGSSGVEGSSFEGVVHGLKLLAVVVVADATLGMSSKFCKDRFTQFLAVATAALVLAMPSMLTQVICLVLAAVLAWLRSNDAQELSVEPVVEALENNQGQEVAKPWHAKTSLRIFVGLLVLSPVLATIAFPFELWADFFHSGSLVFGGGHVVLPLLQETLGSHVSTDRFMLGYAAAQAIPGPMFTFGTFLGAEGLSSQPFLGALIGTFGIFMPGLLLMYAFVGLWDEWATRPTVAQMAAAINAAVVGLLLAALYHPIFEHGVQAPVDMAWVIVGYFVLRVYKPHIVTLVLGFAAMGFLLS